MSDLVARLRDADTTRRIGESYADTHERRQRDRNEAADTVTTLNERNAEYIGTIDRLRRRVAETDVEIERLRAALGPFAKAADGFDGYNIKNPAEWFAYGGVQGSGETTGAITVGDLRRARAALAQEEPND